MHSIHKSHRQHEGERSVQRRRAVPSGIGDALVDAIHDEMPRQLFEFYRRLQFLPVGVTDAQGRPWATILCSPEISALSTERLGVRARVNPQDPFVKAVREAKYFAGVGIDFANRSRVKLAGLVDSAALEGTNELVLTLRANEHMGNCPKYITVRRLRPTQRKAQTTALHARLSPAAREVLQQASTSFVATRHVDGDPRESDMGFNHRGGPKGFLRSFEDEHGTHVVLPDYSGNRFYQSLGNVETDPVMGLAVPDFHSGALLQVTGRARNLFDDEAARLMPGATLVTVITIDEAFLTTGALDLELIGEEQLSPYNPKVRTLFTEVPPDRTGVDLKARLVDITVESERIKTFTFTVPEPIDVVPGGHAIFDFSSRMKRWYQHMNELHPQSLNDDFVRTFTASALSRDRRQFSITVKKSGVISTYLHSLELGRGEPVEFDLNGVGGTFTFDRPTSRMVWVAGGVGITPFLAMYRALRDSGQPMPDIELFYSCRGDELRLIRELTDVKVRVFDSTLPAGARRHYARRVASSDFDDPALLEGATVFVCGPTSFMNDVKSWLEPRVESARLRFETFGF